MKPEEMNSQHQEKSQEQAITPTLADRAKEHARQNELNEYYRQQQKARGQTKGRGR